MKPMFFATPAAFRKWLEKHHATKTELLVGFYKVGSGRKSITWPESVDQALCFGWIDGVRRSIDEDSYSIRFTPRKKNSIWSAVNLRKMKELIASGEMTPAGLAIYNARDPKKANRYSFERELAAFDATTEKRFKANTRAWKYLQECPAGYRKIVTHWITSAKKEETREKRLARLIELCAAGERIDLMKPYG